MLRTAFAIVGGVTGLMFGSLLGPPFDVLIVPVGAFVGYKLAPKRRRLRS